MPRSAPIRALLLPLGIFLLAGCTSNPTATWQPLFNGKDLTGWKEVNGTAPFTVEGDAIVGTTVAGSPNSFLATDQKYGDFIFECEVKQ